MKNPFSHTKHNPDQASPRQGRLLHRLFSDPFLDWAIILVILVLSVVTLVTVGVSMYLAVNARLVAPSSDQSAVRAPFSSTLLTSILADFDVRATIWNAHAASYPVPPDPSLP